MKTSLSVLNRRFSTEEISLLFYRVVKYLLRAYRYFTKQFSQCFKKVLLEGAIVIADSKLAIQLEKLFVTFNPFLFEQYT